ncbi:MAG TPA: hypothetical protein VFT91_08435 [Dehalococcoidia bacterium]|nr:hypothetical protein [Dehalococcoidia bacterium]
MEWGILAIGIVFLFVAYVVIQGTRAAFAWRKAAAAGDVEVIRRIVEDAVSAWASQKRPKEVPADVWRGIQGLELVDVGPDSVRVSCLAQGEHHLQDGRWIETADALQEGIAVAAKAAEMLLYELFHFRPARVQVDVYTTFRDADGATHRQCILSLPATREAARRVDWDDWAAAQIVDALGGRYRLGDRGQPLPIDPGPLESRRKPAPNGRKARPPAGGARAREGPSGRP